jgi:hypothetical protein
MTGRSLQFMQVETLNRKARIGFVDEGRTAYVNCIEEWR